jgi:tetratricopeptide (TPR) repeat protein
MKDECGHTSFIMMEHQPDPTKSRGQYLDLLEVAVKEDPHCHRSCYYYGRELTYRERWQDAINELKRYLDLPTATWALERSHTMRMIGSAYTKLNQDGSKWFRLAVAEDPTVRDNWFDLAVLGYKSHDWIECYGAAKKALTIKENNAQHTGSSETWGFLLYDYVAIAAHHLGLKEEAIKHGTIALQMEPGNERLITNLKFYNEM